MIEQITADQLHAKMAEQDVTLVDVREVFEYRAGHVPGAVSIPLSLIPVRIHELPADAELTIICQSGNRSMQACMWLAQQGRRAVNVHGGTATWMLSGKPVESGVPA
jgi:rhodanese-related sulfurtransferase